MLTYAEALYDSPRKKVDRDLVDLVDVVPVGVGQGDDQQLLVRPLVVGRDVVLRRVEEPQDPP